METISGYSPVCETLLYASSTSSSQGTPTQVSKAGKSDGFGHESIRQEAVRHDSVEVKVANQPPSPRAALLTRPCSSVWCFRSHSPCGVKVVGFFALVFLAILVSPWIIMQFPFKPSSDLLVPTQLMFPMYYTNLDRSTARRAHMERTFGHWGRLIRFPAVDINDEAMINATVDTHGFTPYEYFVERGRGTGPGAGALFVSKALAAKKAYEEGEELILLMEDDMSDILVPYWRFSLKDIVKLAYERHPGWHFIQLQVVTSRVGKALYKSWKIDPNDPFIDRTKLNKRAYTWGCGAVIMSRVGMKTLTDRLFIGSDGKFDCLPEVEKNLDMRCNSDNFVWRLNDKSKMLLVMPPLFVPAINEGSTQIRQKNAPKNDSTANNHDKVHFEASMLVLRNSLLAKAEETFQTDFQINKTAKEAGMWYMKDLGGLKLLFNE